MGQKMEVDYAIELLMINTSALAEKLDTITKFIKKLDERISRLEAKQTAHS